MRDSTILVTMSRAKRVSVTNKTTHALLVCNLPARNAHPSSAFCRQKSPYGTPRCSIACFRRSGQSLPYNLHSHQNSARLAFDCCRKRSSKQSHECFCWTRSGLCKGALHRCADILLDKTKPTENSAKRKGNMQHLQVCLAMQVFHRPRVDMLHESPCTSKPGMCSGAVAEKTQIGKRTGENRAYIVVSIATAALYVPIANKAICAAQI
jgi:hypothetical protein